MRTQSWNFGDGGMNERKNVGSQKNLRKQAKRRAEITNTVAKALLLSKTKEPEGLG